MTSLVCEYRTQLRFYSGRARRTRRERWYSSLPVWIAPLHGGFGLSLRIGDTIFYAFVAPYREPKRWRRA